MPEDIKETVETTEQETVDTQEQVESTEKTFTQAELDAIIQKEKAKAKRSAEKEYQAKMDEAEKLRKMNEQEKADYEAKKQADYIASLEAQIRRTGLEKEASKMLSEAGVTVSEDVLNFVVREDAEQTKQAVDSFSALVKTVAEGLVKESIKGKTPSNVKTGITIPKEDVRELTYAEQVELYNQDPTAYESLFK